MKFILTPSLTEENAHIASEDFQGQLLDFDMGGFFYDYLRNQADKLVGIRYWGMRDTNISKGLLISFAKDPRFSFNEKHNYVDIVFFSSEIPNLKRGELVSDASQDFGGDSVLNFNGERAIAFDLPT